MAMPESRSDREYQKFVETADGPAIRTTAKINVDNVSLSAEMKVDSGHDLYLATTVTVPADGWVVNFDAVAGLGLTKIQSVENKTKGFIYNTKGATVTTTSITLLAASQSEDVTEMETTDEIEVVYRGTSRLTDGTQISNVHGIYNTTEPTLSDGDKAQLQLNEAGELKVTGGAGASSVSAEFVSPSDFNAAYTSTSTITLSGVPFTVTDSSQVAYIKQVKADNTSRTYVNGANDITLLISSNVITVYEKGVVVTTLASGDKYEVGLNSQRKAFDPSTNSTMVSPLVNVWNQYTDAETLVTAQDLTAAYADFGSEIDMRGYNRLGVYIVTDINDSEDVDLKVLGKHESGGTDEYEIDGISVKTLWTTGASDGKVYYEFDVGTIPFIQLQAIAGTLGVTAGDLTIVIDKKWRN